MYICYIAIYICLHMLTLLCLECIALLTHTLYSILLNHSKKKTIGYSMYTSKYIITGLKMFKQQNDGCNVHRSHIQLHYSKSQLQFGL